MNFNRWVDLSVDTDLFLQLQDLTTLLSGHPDFTFDYRHSSFINIEEGLVTGSQYWDNLPEARKASGYKTDVYLRTIGTLRYTDVHALQDFRETMTETALPKFADQLIALLEDIRLEEIIKQERPGTKRAFALRTETLKHYFTSQLDAMRLKRNYALNELFCLIYLTLQADQPDPSFPQADEQQVTQLEQLKPLLYEIFEAVSTRDIAKITEQIAFRIEPYYEDHINDYFAFPISHLEKHEENTLFDELTRTDALANEDTEEVDEENNEYIDERFSSWHRENENNDRQQTFLNFDLDVGTKTNIMGGEARETEDGDQATGSVQGASGQSDKNDYSELEALEKQETSQGNSDGENAYGQDNQDAVAIDKEAKVPSNADVRRYLEAVREIESAKRRLASTIEKTLEHKQNAPSRNLPFGRLSKNLLPLVIDQNPRVFYKKTEKSKEIDAAFTLMVDCSASMHNKMEETKRGVVLFHEVLQQLKIPHAIVGFWEEANEAEENYQPNYFHRIHSYSDSFYANNGAKIMQLEPQEDNRDGFSIRVMTEELKARSEKSKFLLVFSDGEPAASGYAQNGIVDTNVAVAEARKQGIDVIGMFLSEGEINEHDDATMKNIYGRERLMIPSASELPELFAPVLKKLLLRAI